MKRLLVLVAVVSCGGPEAPRLSPLQQAELSEPAVGSLQASQFAVAAQQATQALATDPRNARAAAVRAIATYQQGGHALVRDLGALIEQAERLEFLDHAGGRAAWQRFLDQLDAIDRDLAIVARDPGFALELCLACWEADWNHSGEIDDRDRKLFELEVDASGAELPEGDPRRRPTFRFDAGDADWARAMIAFQRGFGELVLAYKWSDLDKLFARGSGKTLVIALGSKDRVTRARSLILAGLGFADRSRAAYLAETDDDREWVPSPRQHDHPVPLAVDDALYQTWAAITGDVRRMLESKDGLSMRAIARAVDDDLVQLVPDAYIDLGRMLAQPKDIRIDPSGLDGQPDPKRIAAFLQGVLGNGYRPSMPASPLVDRLTAMKAQIDRDEDTFDRKLRYLFWLN